MGQYSGLRIALIVGAALMGCTDPTLPTVESPEGGQDAPISPADTGPPSPPDMDRVEDMAPPELDEALPLVEPPQIPTRIEVKLGSPVTEAGLQNRVTCQAFDQMGAPILDTEELGELRVDIRPQEGWVVDEEDPGLFQGVTANPYEVRCALPRWSLRSPPSDWEVTPAAPTHLVTYAHEDSLQAGQSVGLECVARDDYGNLVELAPELLSWRVSPASEGVSVDLDELGEPSFSSLITGTYQVECSTEGVTELSPTELYVTPGLPASLLAQLSGGRSEFFLNEVVSVETTVLDQYGNEILSAPLSTRLTPNQLDSFGPLRFLTTSPGNFQLQVSVEPPTYEDQEVTQTLSFSVDDGAPTLSCAFPEIGAMRSAGSFFLRGHVEDSAEVISAMIDGEEVEVDESGDFQLRVFPSWGLNIHELSAQDQFGQTNSTICAYFSSPTYLSESGGISDVAVLQLTQPAIDDGAPRSPISSFGDLISGVINSSSLVSTINSAVRAQNPVVPVECRISGLFGSCLTSAGVDFNSLSVGGPNSVALNLRSGGLALDATLRNLVLSITARGQSGFNWSQSGSVTVDDIRLQANLNVGLSGNTPNIYVSGNPTVTIGEITLTLNISVLGGVLNAFLNLVFNAFEGVVSGLISDQIEGFLSAQVDSILTSTLSNIDLSDLGLSLSLPNPFGGSNVTLNIAFALSRLDASSRRLRLGLTGTVSGSTRHSRSSSGVAVPLGSRLVEMYPSGSRDLGGSAHVGLINATLHRLWRAGLFDVQSVAGVLPGLPPELGLSFQTLTPPAIELVGPGTRARLHFGPARAQVSYPGLIDEPITLFLGAWANANVNLSSDGTLSFSAIEIDELKLGTEGLPLSNQARVALQGTFIDILQSIFDTALNDALPVFPIPAFDVPNTFTQYGVPRNLRLGARSLTLEQNGRHLIVKGDFGQ